MMDNKTIRIEVARQKRSTLTAEVLQNIAPYGEDMTGGGIAVFNLAEHEVSCTFSPAEIDGVTECERYLVYDRFSGTYQFVGRNERVDCTLEKSGYRWYVVLPADENCVCLGLKEKYVGFTAVESIHDDNGVQTVVLHEAGTVAWVSENTPQKITVNGKDMTDSAICKGGLINLPMVEKSGQTVVTIS